ncbi:hypothetical protein M378DRAFT_751265 [Amanita muscaria Koide BX008]|uniref:Uncharacterized protein n=1 Tax=Amanita muscaria (strain Koide BX008) TaxID=946122 RepID=A0A0C2T7N3_AMAMK|nr:hypothetical protein M378DRAFT_751265 [Amanita muscaria Koide BX008]
MFGTRLQEDLPLLIHSPDLIMVLRIGIMTGTENAKKTDETALEEHVMQLARPSGRTEWTRHERKGNVRKKLTFSPPRGSNSQPSDCLTLRV